ncbi:MAG: thiamine pyrophosphate-binding protein, partial [Terriglobia bacterium]
DAAAVVEESLALAAKPRPGPVHLSLPSDVAVKACSPAKRIAQVNWQVEGRTSSRLDIIAARIVRSKRPLILVGLGTPPSAASSVRKFVEKLGAPLLVTPKAKGIVSEDHPLFLGVASGMAVDAEIIDTIRMADVILGIGFDPVECDKTWFAGIEIVSVDSASMAGGDYRPVESIGEIACLLDQLTDSVTELRHWPEATLMARRKAICRLPKPSNGGVSPLATIEALRAVFPRDGVVSCDVGSHKLLLGQFWPTYEPGTFFMSNGLSGMGFGVPAAVAAQIAHPDRNVMAIVGDGGMLMMAHDLVLIRELGLPIVIVCLTDGSLSLIRVSQERRGFLPCGVDFRPPSFAALAEAFGIRGQQIKRIEDVKAGLQRALELQAPALLEIHVDFREYYDLV